MKEPIMSKTSLLLTRLDQIGHSLEQTDRALALIALGSVGEDRRRLDDYSDLDFFVIVQPGAKSEFLTQLEWLSSIHPVVYQFRNTVDGYKVLFDDDVFCEFAVFESEELTKVPFAPGRIVWKRPEVDEHICHPVLVLPYPSTPDTAWLVGEALTNLYVGLNRYLRGEMLSAARFIQYYAVDRLVELSSYAEPQQVSDADPFAAERRYEQRFPQTSRRLASFMHGYEKSPESAEAILEFLEAHFDVNQHLAQRIRQLALLARSPEDRPRGGAI
jgi:hypothetical protein